jgi:hypothetical protein
MTSPLQVAMRTLALGVLAAMVAPGQTVLNEAKRIADARKLFETLQDNLPGCAVFPVKPRTLFSLRFEAGYLVRLPSTLSGVPERQWIALTRITPKGNQDQPVYLSQVVQSSIDHEPKVEGSYWLGEGRYAVELLVFDSRGDVCRKDWGIDAHMSPAAAGFKPILAAGEIGGSRETARTTRTSTKSLARVTILLHAASILQNQTLLNKLDKAMLLDGLVALMEELPSGSVRLVAFNLEQQRELFRKDGFTLEALPEVMRVLDALQPAAVDYSSVRNPDGTGDFLENLLSREMHVAQPSDAVVVLGPKSMYKSKPSAQFGLPPGTKQGFYYLECDPTGFLLGRSSTLYAGDWGAPTRAMGLPTRTMQSGIPDDHVWKNYGPNAGADSIAYALARLKGKTVHVDSASSFAAAVTKIIRLSSTNR